eukprot:746977-Hanusia_phi.AAC.4
MTEGEWLRVAAMVAMIGYGSAFLGGAGASLSLSSRVGRGSEKLLEDCGECSRKQKNCCFRRPFRCSLPCLPGTMEKEDQTARTPFGAASRVLVVGSSRGIGLEFVRQLLAKECLVVATHRGEKPGEEMQKLKTKYGQKLELLELDVKDEKSVAKAAETLKARFNGQPQLTHIVHNAGIYGPQGYPCQHMTSTWLTWLQLVRWQASKRSIWCPCCYQASNAGCIRSEHHWSPVGGAVLRAPPQEAKLASGFRC